MTSYLFGEWLDAFAACMTNKVGQCCCCLAMYPAISPTLSCEVFACTTYHQTRQATCNHWMPASSSPSSRGVGSFKLKIIFRSWKGNYQLTSTWRKPFVSCLLLGNLAHQRRFPIAGSTPALWPQLLQRRASWTPPANSPLSLQSTIREQGPTDISPGVSECWRSPGNRRVSDEWWHSVTGGGCRSGNRRLWWIWSRGSAHVPTAAHHFPSQSSTESTPVVLWSKYHEEGCLLMHDVGKRRWISIQRNCSDYYTLLFQVASSFTYLCILQQVHLYLINNYQDQYFPVYIRFDSY